MEMTPLSNHYIQSTINKFYVIGNKVIVNASVFMDQSQETMSVTVRPTLQKQLSNVIQNRNYNLGLSRLWVDTQANPIPAILGKPSRYLYIYFLYPYMGIDNLVVELVKREQFFTIQTVYLCKTCPFL